MSWFAIFGTLFTGVFLGYMLGKDIGEQEGWLKAKTFFEGQR
jgi:hypothetical protein